MQVESIIGAGVAVIVAGMPAMIALLKINQLHVMVNSRLTELLELTKRAAIAEGVIQGRDDVRREIMTLHESLPISEKPPCTV